MDFIATIPARQPFREPWSLNKLKYERSIAMANALAISTAKTYGSAANSYIHFVRIHNLPIEPTEDTLSFFVVYMCNHIQPRSVQGYLSGIVKQLEPFFPNVKAARNSRVVKDTLRGCLANSNKPVTRKRALTFDDLYKISSTIPQPPSHDDLLFLSITLTGFFALLRLGELTFPDDANIHDYRKVARRTSVSISNTFFSFLLPSHKTDSFFEGSTIVINRRHGAIDPYSAFLKYLQSRDAIFPFASPLWITRAGRVPTRKFFINRIRKFFDKDVAGQSMRAGGATALADCGTPPYLIQAMGRWSSEAWLVYIRKHPTVRHALLFPSLCPPRHAP